MQEAWGSKGGGINTDISDSRFTMATDSNMVLCFCSLGVHGPDPSLFFRMDAD